MTKQINGITYTTFEGGKNATELGIDTSRKFIVVDGNDSYDTGDIVYLSKDDNSICPYFKTSKPNNNYIMNWARLAYYDEPVLSKQKGWSSITPTVNKLSITDEMKDINTEEDWKVGDKLCIDKSNIINYIKEIDGDFVKMEEWDMGYERISEMKKIGWHKASKTLSIDEAQQKIKELTGEDYKIV